MEQIEARRIEYLGRGAVLLANDEGPRGNSRRGRSDLLEVRLRAKRCDGKDWSRQPRAVRPPGLPEDVCQYCGADLDESPPVCEVGFLYGVECRRCPPATRRSQVLARPSRVEVLHCPDCGALFAPAEEDPDVLVVKEVTYEVCPACGEHCGVSSVRKLRDVGGGAM